MQYPRMVLSALVAATALFLAGCSEVVSPPSEQPDTAPSFAESVADQTYTEGEAIEPLTLPAATGGNGALSYTLVPAVPGLTFTPSTRTLTGTPATAGSYRMTYRVVDADENRAASDGDSRTFMIAVQTPDPPDTAPRFTESVADQTYTEGEAIESLVLPAATGGNGALSYTLVPAVPGLTFTPSTRTLTGTPATAGSYRMTYRVVDADENRAASDGDSRTFMIAVQTPDPPDTAPRFTESVADQTYTEGEAIESLVLPAATGGNGAPSYTLVPAVPGLTFTPSTRTLTGTPATAGSYRMTYRVVDADENRAASDGDSRTFMIAVQTPDPPDTAPRFTESVADQTYTEGEAIESLVLPAATGGNGALSYTLVPAVPGLTFTPSTRTLTGTPATAGSYRMTYRVVDADENRAASDGDSRTFMIAVQTPDPPDTAPRFTESVADQTYTEGEAIESLVLPAATGGNGALSYTLVPAVPGLTFTPSTRTLTGTPATAGSYRMTYRVVDADENRAASDGDSRTFMIAVQTPDPPDTAPRFTESVADQTYTEGEAIESLVLPAATGGNGAPSYTLVPAVPGLTFTPSTRTLTGTPATVGSYRMTYRVADADENNAASDGDSAHFTIIVQALAPLEGVSITYRGYGDEVFQLNPAGELLDDTAVNLLLGDTRPEVYLIATNPNSFIAPVRIERVGPGVAPTVHGPLPGEEHPSSLSKSDSAVHNSPHWVSEFNNYSSAPRAATQRSSSGLSRARHPVEVGERFIFRSSDDEFENVIEIPATSRKVVTDGTTTLIVWVADDEWGACSECVRQVMVDTFADRFLRPGPSNDIHDWLTALFGSPWGPHDYAELISAEYADDIHILVYDIDADGYVEGGTRRGGYFWAKDNFLQDPNVPGTSNERLMFYMDAPLLAQREGASWDATDYWPSFMISALAHEFQHMIHFYQKRVKHDFMVSETWLNEMSSEAAEDLVAEELNVNGPRGVAYDDSTAGVPENSRGRLPRYNYYNYIQVTAWDYSDTLKHYSISYALGAYLARTYGAGLFRHIVRNDRSGVEAIEAALRSQGHGTSFGDVLVNWAAANLLSDNTRAPAPYRYNPGTWTISRSGGETYRLGSINLFNYRYYYDDGVTYLDGPILYQFEQFSAGVQQRPHSNAYTSLGRATGTVRLNVDARAGSRVTVVIKE